MFFTAVVIYMTSIILSIRIPYSYIAIIDELVNKGRYPNRSAFVRKAIAELIEKELKQETTTTKPAVEKIEKDGIIVINYTRRRRKSVEMFAEMLAKEIAKEIEKSIDFEEIGRRVAEAVYSSAEEILCSD